MKYALLIVAATAILGCRSTSTQTQTSSTTPTVVLEFLPDASITEADLIHISRHKDILLSGRRVRYDKAAQVERMDYIKIKSAMHRTNILACLAGFAITPINAVQFEITNRPRQKITKGNWELEANYVTVSESGEGVAHGNVSIRHKDGRFVAADTVTVDLIADDRFKIALSGDVIFIPVDSQNTAKGSSMVLFWSNEELNR